MGKLSELNKGERKISFLLVVPYTIPQYSGSGINAFNFARFLSKEGINVTILTLNRNMRYSRKEWTDNIFIRRILYFNKNLFLKILSLFLIIPGYTLYITGHEIIMIYGGHLIGYEYILILARLLGKKIIFQSLLVDVDDVETIILNKPKCIRKFYKKLFSRVDIYHSINSIFSDRFRKNINQKETILEMPQGVDTVVFHPAADEIRINIKRKLGIPENNWIILSVGFLIPRKGFQAVFDSLKDLDIPYIYIIAGEFDFREKHFLYKYATEALEIVQKGKKLLGEKLILPGPTRDILEYFQVADIMLFNSIQEGLPNSLLEAMACGIPVVTRNIPGLEGFILKNGQNCFIFKNENELADLLRYLYVNRDVAREISSSAISDIRERASFQNVLSAYYQRLLRNRFE